MVKSKNILEDSEFFVFDKFKIVPKKTNCFFYDAVSWNKLCDNTNSNKLSEGIYFPRHLSANLKRDAPFGLSNFLHEYFGHGLYCEYSLPGRKIVMLDKDLSKLENKLLFNNGSKLREKVLFEKYVSKKNELDFFVKENISNYEGHALWLEHALMKNINQENVFFKKLDQLPREMVSFFEKFYSYANEFGDFALNSAVGFPKFYNKNILVDTLKKKYGEDFDSIDLAILYGSKKPYSDIDLFLVSDKIQSERSHWLDVYVKKKDDLIIGVKNFDISISEPVFKGEIIIGSNYFHENLKKSFLTTPITQEAISYNFNLSKNQENLAKTYPLNSVGQKIALSYAKTYNKNAEELKKGNKILFF